MTPTVMLTIGALDRLFVVIHEIQSKKGLRPVERLNPHDKFSKNPLLVQNVPPWVPTLGLCLGS